MEGRGQEAVAQGFPRTPRGRKRPGWNALRAPGQIPAPLLPHPRGHGTSGKPPGSCPIKATVGPGPHPPGLPWLPGRWVQGRYFAK